MGDGYPDYLLRGLRKSSFLKEGGGIATEAFMPDPRTAKERTDGRQETSIDWQDDDQALASLVARRTHSIAGVVRLARSRVDEIGRFESLEDGSLGYERRPVDGNPRHGNLLFGSAPAYRHRQIASAMALSARYVPRDD